MGEVQDIDKVSVVAEWKRPAIISHEKIPEKPSKIDQILYDEIAIGKWPNGDVSVMIGCSEAPTIDMINILEIKHSAVIYNVLNESKIIGANVTAVEVFNICNYGWIESISLDASGHYAEPHYAVVYERRENNE